MNIGDVTFYDIYTFIYRCGLEIETSFQDIREENIPLELVNYRYHTIVQWERTQFSNSTFEDWCSVTHGALLNKKTRI